MTLTEAIGALQWEIAALRLLIAVSEAARDLPPGGTGAAFTAGRTEAHGDSP